MSIASNCSFTRCVCVWWPSTICGCVYYVQCSFYPPCRSSRVENEEAVSDYQSKYGQSGSEYSCWYNPLKLSQVIQHHRFHLHHVINGVAGSAAFLIASVVLLVCVIRHRRFFKTEWENLTTNCIWYVWYWYLVLRIIIISSEFI